MSETMHNCNINTVILISIIILIMAFTVELFDNFPVLLKLFTNSINFILLNILVILVLLIDLPSGILLAFLLLYLSVYVKNMGIIKKDKINNIVLTSSMINKSINNNNNINIVKNQNNNNNNNNNNQNNNQNDVPPLSTSNSPILSESEINYNNTGRPFPNKNISPFEQREQSQIQQLTHQITSTIENNKHNSISNDTALYIDTDMSEGLYIFKDSQHNMTQYGKPLASCSSYNNDKIKTCGTSFYPLQDV